jgi:phosphopantothenoylcysteine decarboxylase/phosphopantothenate--cysteine ligase
LKSERIDVVIATAAVGDWALDQQYDHKVSTRRTPELMIKLRPTPKIIDEIKTISPQTFLVAFRAEHKLSNEDLIQSAYDRLKRSKADLIAANDVGRTGVGFKVDTNEVFIIDGNRNVVHIPLTTKREVAKRLLDVIAERCSR